MWWQAKGLAPKVGETNAVEVVLKLLIWCHLLGFVILLPDCTCDWVDKLTNDKVCQIASKVAPVTLPPGAHVLCVIPSPENGWTVGRFHKCGKSDVMSPSRLLRKGFGFHVGLLLILLGGKPSPILWASLWESVRSCSVSGQQPVKTWCLVSSCVHGLGFLHKPILPPAHQALRWQRPWLTYGCLLRDLEPKCAPPASTTQSLMPVCCFKLLNLRVICQAGVASYQ